MKVIQSKLAYSSKLLPLLPSKVKFIVLHHAEALQASAEDIHRWHQKRGWSGAGYNEYIRKDGSVYILRGDYQGVHTAHNNRWSYGICLEGNYEKEDVFPLAQLSALAQRLEYHKARFPLAKICFHRDLSPTNCPGKFFPKIR